MDNLTKTVYLEDKDKSVVYPKDMSEEDIKFHLDVSEYQKSPKQSLMESIATNPVVSKVLDFAQDMYPLEKWEQLEEGAKETIKSVPKFLTAAVSHTVKQATFQSTEEEDKQIYESGIVIGKEIFRTYARMFEPLRAVAGSVIQGKDAGGIAKETAKSFVSPEETPTITSQIPMTDWESTGGVERLVPRAIGEAIENVLVYSSFVVKIPELINNYNISSVKSGMNKLAEQLKSKLVNQGYSEQEAVNILLDSRTQEFIRSTPVFQKITGQGITKFYGGIPLPEFKPGQVIKLGKELANVIRTEGDKVVLSIAGKEIVKSISEIPQQKQKGFKWQERGFISSIKEEMPEIKIAGQYVPRSTDRLAKKAKTLINENIDLAEKIALEGTDDAAIATGAELLKHYTQQAEKATTQVNKDMLYDKAAELGNSMAKRLTELGRSVQAASILSRLTPEGQLRFAAKTIQKYNQEVVNSNNGFLGLKKQIPEITSEQSKYILEQMKIINIMPEGEEKYLEFQRLQNYISELVPTPLYDKMTALWKAGLLTGIKTTGVNILSNASHAFTEIIKEIPATGVDSIVSLFTKQRTVSPTFKGTLSGLKEGTVKGFKFLKTGYDERNVLARFDFKKVSFGKGKIAKALQTYEESIFKLLGAEDQPFYYGAKARSIYEQAKVQAINKKLKGEEKAKFIQDLVSNPTDEMLMLSVSDAQISVFQNKTILSEAGKKIQEIPGGEFVLPFNKTPAAYAMQILNYTPVGIVKTIFQNLGKGKFDQKKFSQGLGRGITGIAALALGVYLYDKGVLSLDMPKSEKDRQLQKAEGKSANSILVGDKYRNVNILGPIGAVILLGGQFKKVLDDTGSVSAATGIGLLSSWKTFTEQTFLKGVNQFTTALNEPDRYAETLVNGLFASIVPTLIADIAKATDPTVRRPENMFQKLMERVPGLSRTLEPQIDILGQEVKRKENFLEIMADPTRPVTKTNDEVINEIVRLTESKLPISTSLLGDKKGFKILTQEQNTEMWEQAGVTAYNKIISLMGNPAYENMEDSDRAKEINKIFDKSKLLARTAKVIEITQGLEGDELMLKLSEAKKDGILSSEVFNLYKKLR